MDDDNRLNIAIGPFHDADGVAALLGITRRAVTELRVSGDLLGMQTSDGVWVYPTYQFDNHRRVHPALLPAIRILQGQPGWAIGLWFVTPQQALKGLTPVEWARTGSPVSPLVTVAQHTLAHWRTSTTWP